MATGAWSADLVRTITEDVQPMVSGSESFCHRAVMGDGFNRPFALIGPVPAGFTSFL